MRTAVISFPASNCNRDAYVALHKVTGREPLMIWHQETEIPDDVKFVVLPGGFSYGDYLRCGAIAARSPIVRDLKEKAEKGLNVAGFCNGFQVLTEAGILPGALLRNENLHFVCKPQSLSIVNPKSRFTTAYNGQKDITIPVAHHDGNYFADKKTLDRLEKSGQVIFKYNENINGSARNIAGITNEAGNVLGMMPHPERAVDALHGGTDGTALFQSVLDAMS